MYLQLDAANAKIKELEENMGGKTMSSQKLARLMGLHERIKKAEIAVKNEELKEKDHKIAENDSKIAAIESECETLRKKLEVATAA